MNSRINGIGMGIKAIAGCLWDKYTGSKVLFGNPMFDTLFFLFHFQMMCLQRRGKQYFIEITIGPNERFFEHKFAFFFLSISLTLSFMNIHAKLHPL